MELRIFIALLFAIFAGLVAAKVSEDEDWKMEKNGRIFPVFQVVRFKNTACRGSENKNGTCYTESECSNKGGSAQGTCSSGYGVCCVFDRGCGTTTSENCTYFESSNPSAGACVLEVCKCSSDICQLRLDFNQFVITGPSSSTQSVGQGIVGSIAQTVGSGAVHTPASQCLTDTFQVTNPGGTSPPTICGLNTGEHMYVDASDTCNRLLFQLGSSAAVASTIATRQWSIKISQYSCNYDNLAPEGCTQYYYGSSVDTVRSYNWNGGYHLANQNQRICIRRERGQCRICWTTMDHDTDFVVAGTIADMGYVDQTGCCNYGKSGKKFDKGYDCVEIPGAVKGADTTVGVPGGERFCGRSKGLQTAAAAGATPATVCSFETPFQINFISDTYESAIEAMRGPGMADTGFQLTYIQTSTGC